MRLETERLFIREWQDSDTDIYQVMAKDVGYNVFSPPGHFLVKDDTEALAKIRQRQSIFKAHRLGKFPVFLKSREFIGTCGIDPYTHEGKQEVELGYRLLLNHWGKGYATEAAKAIVDYGLKEIRRARILAFAVQQNPQSLKIIEKLGFKYLGVFEHAAIPHKLYDITTAQLR